MTPEVRSEARPTSVKVANFKSISLMIAHSAIYRPHPKVHGCRPPGESTGPASIYGDSAIDRQYRARNVSRLRRGKEWLYGPGIANTRQASHPVRVHGDPV